MRSIPIGRATSATTTPTTGEAFPFPLASVAPFIAPTQVKVYVDGAAYVGFGAVLTPIPATSATTSVYQEATTEEVYDVGFGAGFDALFDHLYVYAVSGTITVRVSWFG